MRGDTLLEWEVGTGKKDTEMDDGMKQVGNGIDAMKRLAHEKRGWPLCFVVD